MEHIPTPSFDIKTTTLCRFLILIVVCGVTVVLADTYLYSDSDRQLAALGILTPGAFILLVLVLYVSGAVTEVKPYTAYVESDPDQDYPLQQGDIIFDNHHDATCLRYPQLSGQEINYSIQDIPLNIQAEETTVKYQVGWEGKLRQLFAIQILAVGHDHKIKQSQFSLKLQPSLWFERWVRHKNNELQDHITSLEERAGSFSRQEIEQRVYSTHGRVYEDFGLKLDLFS